jgi:putative ABC transport system permease protein
MGLSGLYALMAVVNAVVMAGSSRTREFAVLRVTGLSRAQVGRTALIESSAVTAIGLVLGGLVVTAALAGVASAAVNSTGTATVDIPWAAVTATVAFAATGVTALLTALSVTRTSPIRLSAARE